MAKIYKLYTPKEVAEGIVTGTGQATKQMKQLIDEAVGNNPDAEFIQEDFTNLIETISMLYLVTIGMALGIDKIGKEEDNPS